MRVLRRNSSTIFSRIAPTVRAAQSHQCPYFDEIEASTPSTPLQPIGADHPLFHVKLQPC